MSRNLFVILAILGSLWGCVTPEQKPDPPPGPGGNDCEAACGNLVRLSCKGAQGSPGRDDVYGTADDVGCVQACSDIEAAGMPMPKACVAAAASCGAVDDCQ